MDPDALFPSRDDPDPALAADIAAVCARLGLPEEWRADDGYEHAIVGGAVAGGRVAWVERRALDDGGWVDIDYFLRARVDDGPTRAWTVATYNPYFGCDVGLLRWYGDRLALVYQEKHRTIACALDAALTPRMRALDHHWRVVGDLAVYAGHARGLAEQVRLPDLEPRCPLPFALLAAHLAAGTSDLSPGPVDLPPPADPAGFRRAVAARLPALPAATADLLIGALAYRFWAAHPPPAASYEAVSAQTDRHWNPPCWLPFYVHHASRPADARALLARLDAVAARPTAAPLDAAELAARHLADRCRELADACRIGHLPEGTRDYFWAPWSQEAFAGLQARFPAGMTAAWTALRPHAARLLALGERR